MLWHKGWLETRFRLLFTLGFTTIILVLQYSARTATPPPGGKSAAFGLVMFAGPTLVLMVCALLGGAGIVTQPSLQATKGLHGSTLFTLSLPVSRLRLLAVRASIGWFGMGGVIAAECCGMWLLLPGLKETASAIEMSEFFGAVLACASALYF